MLTLVPVSVLIGAAAAWVFAHAPGREAAAIRRRMSASFYELRLFADEPALMFQAQWSLIQSSARYLIRMLSPAWPIALVMLVLVPQIDHFYGRAPLEIGEPAIVTLKTDGGVPVLRAPQGIAVETPPVRAGREISWRIRPTQPIGSRLEFVFPNQIVSKTIVAGAGFHYLSERRVRSIFALLSNPSESRLPPGTAEWIEIDYPPATIHAFGLDAPWFIWMFVISTLSALALRNSYTRQV